MAYPISRPRSAPELVVADSVSEYESPVPSIQPEALEDILDIQELFVGPSLSRRPAYRRGGGSDYENPRSIPLAPPTLDIYPEEYQWAGERPPLPLHDAHDYDRRRERDWHQRRCVSPQSSCSSSSSSALDCGECAYTEPKRRYDNHYRRTQINLVPYDIIPGDNVGQRASSSPAHANAAHYIHAAPRVYRPHGFQSPPQGFWDDSTTSNLGLRNHIREAARSSSSEGWIASDGVHSSVSSSPGWSTREQRQSSGSEMRSSVRSESPSSPFDEDPYVRFARQTRRPWRTSFSHQRPVVITRSNDGDDYEDYSNSSRSDWSYSSNERYFSRGGYYRRD